MKKSKIKTSTEESSKVIFDKDNKIFLVDEDYYALNKDFIYGNELEELVLKSSPSEKTDIVNKVNRLGKIKVVILAGVFMRETLKSVPKEEIDLFIVGDDVDSRKLSYFLKTLEAEVGRDIRYAVMEKEEFKYRLGMFDRFVYTILEGPHEKIVNKLGI